MTPTVKVTMTGPPGPPGPGVPVGGTTGQVLQKASGADHDTTWVTPTVGALDDLDEVRAMVAALGTSVAALTAIIDDLTT